MLRMTGVCGRMLLDLLDHLCLACVDLQLLFIPADLPLIRANGRFRLVPFSLGWSIFASSSLPPLSVATAFCNSASFHVCQPPWAHTIVKGEWMEACFQNGLSGEQAPRTKENKSSRKRRRCQRLSICRYAVQTLPPAIGMVADGCLKPLVSLIVSCCWCHEAFAKPKNSSVNGQVLCHTLSRPRQLCARHRAGCVPQIGEL